MATQSQQGASNGGSGKLSGKTALVTGGTRGIGRAIVERLAHEGAKVAFSYVAGGEKAQQLVDALSAQGATVVAIQSDQGEKGAPERLVAQAVEKLGKLDILVNNAGVLSTGSVGADNTDWAVVDRMMAINVAGVIETTRAAAKVLSDHGRIVSVGSILGEESPFPGIADYSASKAAIAAYSRGWARDLGPRGITVNTVQPGPTNTEMNPETAEGASQQSAGTALGRFGQPEEVAAAVAFFASDEASYITGASLNVDGGFGA